MDALSASRRGIEWADTRGNLIISVMQEAADASVAACQDDASMQGARSISELTGVTKEMRSREEGCEGPPRSGMYL